MSGEREQQIITEALERLQEVQERQEAAARAVREAADETQRICQEVTERTGVEIALPPRRARRAVMDTELGELASLAQRCGRLLAAVELLGAHVEEGSARTAGAALKTGLDLSTAAEVARHLDASGFFLSDEEGSDG